MKRHPQINPSPSYSYHRGLQAIQRLVDQGRFIFTVDELKPVAQALHLSENYLLSSLLTRLEGSGWITKLRRGLYATTGGLPGQTDIHPFAIATRLVEPSAISHWSALHHHGLTEQLPHGVTAITPKKVITPSMRRRQKAHRGMKHAWTVGNQRFEYTTVRPDHYFGLTHVWMTPQFQVPMTDKERTILDCFVSPEMFGGIAEVLHILEEHLRELDFKKLVQYALQYNKLAIVKRVGWGLEQAGVPEHVTQPLLQVPASTYIPLDPGRPRKGPCERRWMIQKNLTATNAS